MRLLVIASAGLSLGALAAAGPWVAGGPGSSDPATDVHLERGAALYAEYCSACHGTDLEGQPDWQSPGPDGRLPAPPHDDSGHTWHHSDRVLFGYTKFGGRALLAREGIDYDSGMPGFDGELTDRQIWKILAFIKSRWSARQQAFQAEATANDPGDT